MQKAAEKALPDIFFGGFKDVNTEFRNKSYNIIEDVHTEMASNYFLDDMFKHNL